jgi:hypothetical protein
VDPWNALAPQVLKIAKPDTNEYYYLSYRRPLGFDANLSSTYLDQLNIHRYKGSGTVQTYFLDALLDGESFVDAVNGMTIIQKSRTNDYVTVQVSLDTTCSPAIPTVSLAPTSQSAAPGVTLNYTISVTNQDGVLCPPTTWTLSSVLPAGWTATLSRSTLTLSPGGTGTATLAVTSAPGAAEGNYSVEVDVTDGTEPLHSTSDSATYVVMIDDESPTAPTGLSATFWRNRVDLSWKAATDNLGVSGYTVWRNGVSLGGTTATSYSDSAITTGSTYTYWVVAYDAAGNASAPSNSATVTIQKGGKK